MENKHDQFYCFEFYDMNSSWKRVKIQMEVVSSPFTHKHLLVYIYHAKRHTVKIILQN